MLRISITFPLFTVVMNRILNHYCFIATHSQTLLPFLPITSIFLGSNGSITASLLQSGYNHYIITTKQTTIIASLLPLLPIFCRSNGSISASSRQQVHYSIIGSPLLPVTTTFYCSNGSITTSLLLHYCTVHTDKHYSHYYPLLPDHYFSLLQNVFSLLPITSESIGK